MDKARYAWSASSASSGLADEAGHGTVEVHQQPLADGRSERDVLTAWKARAAARCQETIPPPNRLSNQEGHAMFAKSIGLAALSAVFVATSIAYLGDSSAAPSTKPPAKQRALPLFEACQWLHRAPSDAHWREVLGLAAAIRDEALRRAERSPLEKPQTLADPQKLSKLSKAAPGLHSLIHTVRYASTVPPGPGGSYLHTAAVVIDGDLKATVPDQLKTRRSTRGRSWDGYIHGCVVVVDGEIDTTSYIFDSIIIAKGPVRLGGYIYNSIVISLGSEGESLIDVGGYLNHTLVVAENVKVQGYVFETIVYGKLTADDLRGADLRQPESMLRLVGEIEKPVSLDR
jgi:hypothetical protein